MILKKIILPITLFFPLLAQSSDIWVDKNTCTDLPGTWDDSTTTCTLTGDVSGVRIIFGANNLTLDGAGHTIYLATSGEDVILSGDSPTLKNVVINGSSGVFQGVRISQALHATISNVSISGPFYYGIDIRSSPNTLVENSSVSGIQEASGTAAISLAYESTNCSIINNTLTGNYGGSSGIIYTEYLPSNNIVRGNTISNFTYGLKDYGNSGNTNYQNNFIGNLTPRNAPPGVTFSLPAPDGGNYYSNFDEEAEGCYDLDNDGFCDAAYGADELPWLYENGWVSNADAEGTVTVADGGTVATDDGSVVIDVPAYSVSDDTDIQVVLQEVTSPDVFVGDGTEPQTALALYEFGPDGTTFDPAATLTLSIDVTTLTELERSMISIYRHEDTDGDGDIDEKDGYLEIPGTTCTVSEDPAGTFIATCTAPIEHFSSYALILLNDSDNDGIADSVDVCPDENALGFDVDNDGCIDSYDGLSSLANTLAEEGAISYTMMNSLLSKIANAEKSATKDNLCASINELEALKNQIAAQTDKKVSFEAASVVNNYVDSIINYLYSFLGTGETCS